MKKCLLVMNDENYILFLNGSKPEHLFDAIKKKREIYKVLSSDRKGHEFLIFDKDFNTFVHLDGDTQIEHLSRILIRPKATDGAAAVAAATAAAHKTASSHPVPHPSNHPAHYPGHPNNNHHTTAKTRSQSLKGDTRSQSESIVISINPNDLSNQSTSSQTSQLMGQLNSQMNQRTNSSATNKNDSISNNGNNNNNCNQIPASNSCSVGSSLTNNSGFVPAVSLVAGSAYNSEPNNSFDEEVSNGQANYDGQADYSEIEVEWPEDDTAALLECCQQFTQNLAFYNISIDLAYLEQQDEELWEQIAVKVRRCTDKSYNKAQCKSKFLELRTKYINVKAISGLENSYFCQQRYYNNLKQLVDGLKPSIDLLQLNGQLKTRNMQRGKILGPNDKNSYLYLIQQVKTYARQFNENAVSKNTVWQEIATNLNEEGFKFTAKSCQALFHRLRYSYLHLLKTVATDEEGQERWPYFHAFSGIDLTPFTSRRQEGKPKPRLSKNGEDGSHDQLDLEDDSNEHLNDPGFDHFGVDSLHDGFSFDHFTNPVKRMRGS